jgi:hypothetical protein
MPTETQWLARTQEIRDALRDIAKELGRLNDREERKDEMARR